jgi:site-specific recombinase XerD
MSAWTTGAVSSYAPGSRDGRSYRPAVLHRTQGRAWSAAAARSELRRLAARAGVRRRFAPNQLRHAHARELAREGVPLNTIQRQLGHANLGTTSIYRQGIDPGEIITAVRTRRAPMMSVRDGRRL